MEALRRLRVLVEETEHRTQLEAAQKEFAVAEAEQKTTWAALEASRNALAAVRQRIGNAEQKYAQRIKEFEELRTKAGKLEGQFADQNEVTALLASVQAEIEKAHDQDVTALRSAENDQEICHKTHLAALERLQTVDECLTALSGKKPTLAQTGGRMPPELIKELEQEVVASEPQFLTWPKDEQRAMLAVWGGRARMMQDQLTLTEELKRAFYPIFGLLGRWSREQQPGFVEALDRSINQKWTEYVETNRATYLSLVERRRRLEEQKNADQAKAREDQARRREARLKSEIYFGRMVELCAAEQTPEAVQELREIVLVLLDDVGLDSEDEDLVEMLYPLRGLFTQNSSFRALRRAFERYENRLQPAAFAEQFPAALAITKGKRAVVIGGSPREERRTELTVLFQFAELAWESCQGKEPQVVNALSDRIRNRGVDLVIELTNFVGHHIETLKDLCERNGVSFVKTHGYGPQRMAKALVEQGG